MRRALLVTALALLAAPAPASASAGGLFPTFGGSGATASGPPFTYVTLPAGKRSVVEAIHKGDASVQLYRRLPGSYGTPMVAIDGSQTGLSADGTTLVLVKSVNRYPPQRTDLLVLHAQGLQTKTQVSLPGFSSVDAISPDGRWVYLTHYTKPASDPNAYEVRAYDLKRHRMDPRPLVDPREPDEKMTGQPLTRVMSADDRWAYTLYSGDEPFVHALDTVNKVAYCIDLKGVSLDELTQSVKLTLSGPTLHVANLADIDTRTNEQVKAAATPAPTPRAAPKKHQGGSPWPFVALGLVALGVLAVVVRRRRSVHEVVDLHVAVHHPEEEPTLPRL
jgi:MYXO-CTERM domain-containing protein